MSEKLPITEQSNKITKNIDKATSVEMINLFSKTDKQLFNYQYDNDATTEAKDTTALYDLLILNRIEKLADIIQQQYEAKANFKIILSGCGTSGRLAYICAKNLNEYLKQDLCEYIIAGGDYALINSVEAVEDSPQCGVDELKKIIENLDTFMYIGITCGLSAPFVAGQLDYCFYLDDKIKSKVLAIGLIGFNPVELARKNEFKLTNYNDDDKDRISTFYRLIHENLYRSKFYLLNPLIGPEPITGSSRMKSGSATKILLDLIFLKFLFKNINLKNLVSIYENAIETVLYKLPETQQYLASLIDKSSNALRNSHTISYLSKNMQIGILGCVDASECIPTFGAERNDIRGFIDYENYNDKYWNEIKSFPETSIKSNEFKNAFNDPTNFVLAISSNVDLSRNGEIYNLKPIYENFEKFLHNLKQNNNTENELFRSEIFKNNLEFILIKLCLNAISTASYVKQGKTYENYMIDVKTSNFKLYKRAIHIINLLSPKQQQQTDEIEQCLLKSIYSTENLTNISKLDVSKHIEIAKNKKYIVPIALLMNITKCKYEEASNQLNNCSTVRTCIENIIKNNS